jgi:hypothetical protein
MIAQADPKVVERASFILRMGYDPYGARVA